MITFITHMRVSPGNAGAFEALLNRTADRSLRQRLATDGAFRSPA